VLTKITLGLCSLKFKKKFNFEPKRSDFLLPTNRNVAQSVGQGVFSTDCQRPLFHIILLAEVISQQQQQQYLAVNSQ